MNLLGSISFSFSLCSLLATISAYALQKYEIREVINRVHRVALRVLNLFGNEVPVWFEILMHVKCDSAASVLGGLFIDLRDFNFEELKFDRRTVINQIIFELSTYLKLFQPNIPYRICQKSKFIKFQLEVN